MCLEKEGTTHILEQGELISLFLSHLSFSSMIISKEGLRVYQGYLMQPAIQQIGTEAFQAQNQCSTVTDLGEWCHVS